MKRNIFKYFVFFVIISSLFIACNDEGYDDNVENKHLNILKKKIVNKTTINSIKSLLNNQNGISNKVEEMYDFENAELVSLNQSQDTAIVVPSLSNDENEIVNSSLIIGYEDDIAFGEVFVVDVKNVNLDNTLIEVIIKTVENEVYSTAIIDNVNNTSSVTNYDLSARRPCGKAVMDCISDAYSNHGWTSVALGLTSAYIPHTFAVVAAACYDRNCH